MRRAIRWQEAARHWQLGRLAQLNYSNYIEDNSVWDCTIVRADELQFLLYLCAIRETKRGEETRFFIVIDWGFVYVLIMILAITQAIHVYVGTYLSFVGASPSFASNAVDAHFKKNDRFAWNNKRNLVRARFTCTCESVSVCTRILWNDHDGKFHS